MLGDLVEGIWPPESDVTDVNSACLSHDKLLLATGDDFGFVKVFDFPAKVREKNDKKIVKNLLYIVKIRNN